MTVNVLPLKPNWRQEKVLCEKAKLARTTMLPCSGDGCVSPRGEDDKLILGAALSIPDTRCGDEPAVISPHEPPPSTPCCPTFGTRSQVRTDGNKTTVPQRRLYYS